MKTISFRLNDRDDELVRKYAEYSGQSLSDFIRKTVLEKIEDESDLELFDRIWNQEKDKKTYSLDEVKKELGI
ncbi:MAG: DUF6290 family protein [Clostridia bacterium]|nr:DUF6290 family protein [Clostridia bacterium]